MRVHALIISLLSAWFTFQLNGMRVRAHTHTPDPWCLVLIFILINSPATAYISALATNLSHNEIKWIVLMPLIHSCSMNSQKIQVIMGQSLLLFKSVLVVKAQHYYFVLCFAETSCQCSIATPTSFQGYTTSSGHDLTLCSCKGRCRLRPYLTRW